MKIDKIRHYQSRYSAAWRWCLLSPVVLLVACAVAPTDVTTSIPLKVTANSANPTQERELRALIALQDRLYNVSAPLLVNNAALCKNNARKLFGFTAKTKYSYSTEFVTAAQSVLGLDDRLQITGLLPNSGAASAGLRRGDILLAVDGTVMPEGANAERQAATMLGPIVATHSKVNLTLLRNGSKLTLNVPLTLACAFGVELGNADIVNGYSDGRRVLITRGMINFTRSDQELAYVIGTEMAHNALAHAHRQKMSATISGVIDNLILIHPDSTTLGGTGGIKSYSADQDASANALGLYMVARAGYDTAQAAAFWRRLATEYPPSIPSGYTAIHPSTINQLATIAKTDAEIKDLQRAKKPLLP